MKDLASGGYLGGDSMCISVLRMKPTLNGAAEWSGAGRKDRDERSTTKHRLAGGAEECS